MAGEWEPVLVGEIAESVSDTHLRAQAKLVFLNTSDVLLGKVLHRTYSDVRNWPGQAKKSICRDDILFSEIRPANGRWAFIDFNAEDFVVSTKLMVIRPRTNRVVPRFLYHFLTSAKTTGWLQHLAESRSGTFPQITFDQVAELELELPPLGAQEGIAKFLDCIDSKIEVSRRMNETLEAMARALFKSWFVDFDPVRAKAEGRNPNLPTPLAALFPDSFEGSPLGEIPMGWGVRTIGDLADIVGGSTPSTTEPTYWDGGTCAWATPKDLAGLSVPVLLDTERRITGAGLAQIGSGLLPKGTVLLSSRAPIGYLAIAEVPVAVNQGFVAMRPKAEISNLFLLFWASVAHDEIVSRANGSTFLEISKANFRPIPIVKPSPGVMQAFEHLARPMYERIVECARESRMLTALRDALLPKLISGELRLTEVAAVSS
ncbi:restriction endonuclease subunit S [Usitatibacter palustris]|uniref:Type I restriction modification DNA specificity domain-containing protein n=1 Tax=Usitatibacter palustris TaxID=2732487 RepID=A0A6M4HBN4_9PROT|nr:restriction endonuclease subunit S [Usitatibacter palustris]QJR15377.1 hypothetical protein DSM104440_02196 [Usitatibacter palustris]